MPLVEQARFHRGFVESITVEARAFLARGAELYALTPIRSVTLIDAKPVFRELMESDLLGQLAELGLQTAGLGDDDVRVLAECPRLANLRLLDLSFNALTRAGLELLAGSKHLTRLVNVNLAGSPCGDPIEDYGIDGMMGWLVPSPGSLPPLGRELEAKYGPLAWLHAPSRLLTYPPTLEDV